MSRHDEQRGAVLVLVMTLLAALFAAAATVLYLQLSSTRSAGLVSRSRGALFCAEAGLVAARPIIGNNYASWPAALDQNPATTPAFVYPIVGDIDNDGVNDYSVTIRDNDDELPPRVNDPSNDNDLSVFIVSECTKYPDMKRKVMELVTYQGGGNVYRNQAGYGPGGTGNKN